MVAHLRARLCHCTLWLSRAVQEKNCLRARKLGPLELLEANIKTYKDEKTNQTYSNIHENATYQNKNDPNLARHFVVKKIGPSLHHQQQLHTAALQDQSSARKDHQVIRTAASNHIKSPLVTICHNYIVRTCQDHIRN